MQSIQSCISWVSCIHPYVLEADDLPHYTIPHTQTLVDSQARTTTVRHRHRRWLGFKYTKYDVMVEECFITAATDVQCWHMALPKKAFLIILAHGTTHGTIQKYHLARLASRQGTLPFLPVFVCVVPCLFRCGPRSVRDRRNPCVWFHACLTCLYVYSCVFHAYLSDWFTSISVCVSLSAMGMTSCRRMHIRNDGGISNDSPARLVCICFHVSVCVSVFIHAYASMDMRTCMYGGCCASSVIRCIVYPWTLASSSLPSDYCCIRNNQPHVYTIVLLHCDVYSHPSSHLIHDLCGSTFVYQFRPFSMITYPRMDMNQAYNENPYIWFKPSCFLMLPWVTITHQSTCAWCLAWSSSEYTAI